MPSNLPIFPSTSSPLMYPRQSTSRSSSPSPPLSAIPLADGDGDDEISAELAKLENLRINVKQNLSLRPLKAPPATGSGQSSTMLGTPSSNDTSPPPSAIRRTFKGPPPPLALKKDSIGSNVLTDSSGDTGSTASTGTSSPTSPNSLSDGSDAMLYSAISPSGPQMPPSLHSPSDIIAHYANHDADDSPLVSPAILNSAISRAQIAAPMATTALATLLSSNQSRPLLLDTRPAGPYMAERLKGSINLAIPTLILKRWKRYLEKDKSGQEALAQAIGDSVRGLAGFVTTDGGKEEWDRMLGHDDVPHPGASSLWNGDIVVYDEEMDEADPLTPAQSRSKPSPLQPSSSASPTTSWLLISVLSALPSQGGQHDQRVYWLKGGLAGARKDRILSEKYFVIEGGDEGTADPSEQGGAGTRVSELGSPKIKAVYTSSPTEGNDATSADNSTQSRNAPLSVARSSSTLTVSGGHPVTASSGGGVGGLAGSGSGAGAVGSGPLAVNTPPKHKKPRPQHLEVAVPVMISAGSSASSSEGGVVVDGSGPGSHEPPSSSSMLSSSPSPGRLPSSIAPSAPPAAPFTYSMLYDASPSPSPSTTTANIPFPRTPTATTPTGSTSMRMRSNTGMLPKLARLDTKSRERLAIPPINTNLGTGSSSKANPPPLPSDATAAANMPPKLHLRTTPFKSATLAAPIASPKVGGFGLKLHLPPSPSRPAFNGVISPTADFQSPLSGTSVFFTPVQTPSDFQAQYPFTPADSSYHSTTSFAQFASFGLPPPRSPGTQPTTPLTARPPASPMSASALTSESESAMPPFVISTILPGFLFLGPELSTEDQAQELQGLGVRRILNMAIECEPEDYGLDLERRFDRYLKIPMRDTVEEDRVAKALKEVCDFVDDARLHSSPVYVHCKAGKSRSVTAVMAYLIHANHWPLSRAYAFVNERRRGVSPNIGFVSELMTFEEQKLGGKSVGVVPDNSSSSSNGPSESRRTVHPHARDSLPPAFAHTQAMSEAMSLIGVPVTAGGVGGTAVGAGAGEEMEIKDHEGRYRHARRAPVDELTLQPLRRVSKAGLETTW